MAKVATHIMTGAMYGQPTAVPQNIAAPLGPPLAASWNDFQTRIRRDDLERAEKSRHNLERLGGAAFRHELAEVYTDPKGAKHSTLHEGFVAPQAVVEQSISASNTVPKPTQHAVGAVRFDPKKHLARVETPKVLQMQELGYPKDTGVSPVAVSDPFQLFTPEAIQIMREEIFQPVVRETCGFSSNIAACQLRGYAKEHAPFAHQAWNHPETLAIMSQIAGVELVPVMDYEIGHINLSMKTEEQTRKELSMVHERRRSEEEAAGCTWEDDKPIVGWHTDSYPFVCVLMMSDCTNMVGGETALRKADGEVLKVRGPTQGCAVILQGRYILHQAMRALGAQERITSVTSFRPKSAFLKDDTVLRTVRPVSDLSGLYGGFAEYRLDILEQRIRRERQKLAARKDAGEKFDTIGHKKFLKEVIGFAEKTDGEIVEDDKVLKGIIDEVDLPDVKIEAKGRMDSVVSGIGINMGI